MCKSICTSNKTLANKMPQQIQLNTSCFFCQFQNLGFRDSLKRAYFVEPLNLPWYLLSPREQTDQKPNHRMTVLTDKSHNKHH